MVKNFPLSYILQMSHQNQRYNLLQNHPLLLNNIPPAVPIIQGSNLPSKPVISENSKIISKKKIFISFHKTVVASYIGHLKSSLRYIELSEDVIFKLLAIEINFHFLSLCRWTTVVTYTIFYLHQSPLQEPSESKCWSEFSSSSSWDVQHLLLFAVSGTTQEHPEN